MKDINTCLTELNDQLIINNSKKERIDLSIENLKKHIWGLFQGQLHDVKVFGSYERGTMLSIDEDADVDIAIIFKQKDFEPETYLRKVKEMCVTNYPRSTIYRDYPTIVIEMEHIKFEVIPSYLYSTETIKVPAKLKQEIKWESTSPLELRNKLFVKDKDNNGMILPIIRILKYWNMQNGKLFRSYLIEKFIIEKSFNCRTLKGYFLSGVSSIGNITMNEEQKQVYLELKERLRRLDVLETQKIPEYIEPEFNIFLPPL